MLPNSNRFIDRSPNGPAWILVAVTATLGCGEGQPSPAVEGGAGVMAAGGRGGGAGSGTTPEDTGGAGAAVAGAAGQEGAPLAEEPMARLVRYHGSVRDRALRFELDAVRGLSPFASSLDYLSTFVARAVDKPDGISFEEDETLEPFGEEHVWSFDELDAFARQHTADDSAGVVTIHVMFIDGRYDSGDDSGTVLGLAWGQRHIALFQDAIREGCSRGLVASVPSDTCEVAERNVWAHEIGHVIGLVDNGLTQQSPHRDADHGRHDQSDGCLMYWAYERPEVFDMLLSRLANGQSSDVDFCPNCWADLRAFGD
jgi:hypothetical protein